jgi:hypothetical protein
MPQRSFRLRNGPIARGGIQFRIDRTGLNVVDRDAAATDFSGQRLSEHLDGSLRARVRNKSRCRYAFTDGRTDHDDAAIRPAKNKESLSQVEKSADKLLTQ